VLRTPLSLFRTLAIAETVSWTLLIAGLVVRATTGFAPAVTVGGGIHGFVFLAYAVTAVLVAKNQRWSAGTTLLALACAVVPYATVPLEIRLARSGRLAGAWRTEQSTDPRDAAWHDRLLRAVLRRPTWSLGAVGSAVIVVFVALLIVGPPGGRG
jgi:integral membrane protein